MSEQGDDTTERDAPSPRESEPGRYYYDDTTGYEIYDPSKDDDDDQQEDEEAAEAAGADAEANHTHGPPLRSIGRVVIDALQWKAVNALE